MVGWTVEQQKAVGDGRDSRGWRALGCLLNGLEAEARPIMETDTGSYPGEKEGELRCQPFIRRSSPQAGRVCGGCMPGLARRGKRGCATVLVHAHAPATSASIRRLARGRLDACVESCEACEACKALLPAVPLHPSLGRCAEPRSVGPDRQCVLQRLPPMLRRCCPRGRVPVPVPL